MNTSAHVSQLKQAELLSAIGAGILGAGIALLLPKLLAPYAMPILLLGLVSHWVGMFQKHGLEAQPGTARVAWAEALYWLCWIALAALLFYIVVRQITGS